MRAVGPLWNISCICLESIHRNGKVTSRESISRVNVCRTIASKHQLILNYRLMSKTPAYQVSSIGPTKMITFEKFPEFGHFFHFMWK